MTETIARWHDDHVHFAKLLDFLDKQLDLFHGGDMPNYDLMLDIMFYMTHYPDVLHHPKEDLAFARIREREGSIAAVVDDLERQHGDLHSRGEALVSGLGDIINGSIASRESVEAPAREYVAAFRRHMDIEEEKILPLAARLLRDSDWSEIEIAIEHIDDPLFGHNPSERYAALEEHLGCQVAAS